MSDRRPVIGICAALERARWAAWDRPAVLLAHDYTLAIQDAGGMALMIPPDPRLERNPDEALDVIDGLILAGGADVDPSMYGAEPHPKTKGTVPERDRTELAIARGTVERGLPILGICRGMQLLNVAMGGTLRQHAPDDVGHEDHRRHLGSFEDSEHDVRLEPGSLAADAAGEELHTSKSHHHQVVASLGEGLRVTGASVLDDLPEAIEAHGPTFCLGVQWHPEADRRSRVVAALVRAAREHRDQAARDHRDRKVQSHRDGGSRSRRHAPA
jgi:putative glutamine amidotransferase